MRPDQCCGSTVHHCRWCGEHKVVPVLVEDHEQDCDARTAQDVA